MYPTYRDIPNWVIINECTIHDFTIHETPISVVNVLIGTLHYDQIGLDGKPEHRRTPITRWITKNQFNIYQQRTRI